MCRQCSALEKAHRDCFQQYLHLTARRNRPQASLAVEAALSEAVAKLNEAWQRMVEHRADHREHLTISQPAQM